MLDANLREFQRFRPDAGILQREASMRVNVDPQRVRQVFQELSGSSAFQESRALAEAGGLPVEMLQAMSLRPEILRAFGETGI